MKENENWLNIVSNINQEEIFARSGEGSKEFLRVSKTF